VLPALEDKLSQRIRRRVGDVLEEVVDNIGRCPVPHLRSLPQVASAALL
jgi:hypothetical protein